MEPLISVIIPVYNVEKYLRRCLQSVCTQTCKDIEIIVVNDGTKDDSQIIVNEYASIDKRIKTIIKENGGLSSARNAGLEVAEGKYISFVDSDDWIDPNMLESMYNRAIEGDADIVVSNYRRIYDEKVIDNYLELSNENINLEKIGFEGYFYKFILTYSHGHEVWNKIYRRERIINNFIKFVDNKEIFSEDLLFNLTFLCHTKKISSMNLTFYNYLQREGSLAKLPLPNLSVQYSTLVKEYKTYLEKIGNYEMMKDILPILFYTLLNASLANAFATSGEDYNAIKFALERAAILKDFKKYMWKLAFGKSIKYKYTKINTGLKRSIVIRLFGLCCLLGLYKLVSLLKYRRFSMSNVV